MGRAGTLTTDISTTKVPRERLPLTEVAAPPRIVTLRAVLLGLIGATIICGIAYYNDFVLNNTYVVGNNLPLGLTMMAFFFALLINGPLSRYMPRWAFSSGEMTVALCMIMVACAVPTSGLHRYLPPSLVGSLWLARSDPDFLRALTDSNLPAWWFPAFSGSTPQEWMNDPVVSGYLGRWSDETPIPYLAWVRPMLVWAVFVGAFWGSILCLTTLIRRQWYENERLIFPLAQIPMALVEQPKPGQWLNSVLRSRGFWIAFAAVFFIHLWNGCVKYYPRYFPEIPLRFDMINMLGERPWSYMDWDFKRATFFFTAAAVTYFLSSSIAFSMWFGYAAMQMYKMALGTMGGETSMPGNEQLHFGAVIAFALSIIWIGRNHWKLVLKQAFRGARPDEPQDRYMSYPVAFWGLVVCFITMVGFLSLAGMTLHGALVIIVLLLTTYMIVARIGAETGLIHIGIGVPLHLPFTLTAAAGWRTFFPVRDFILGGYLHFITHDQREALSTYATHSIKVSDQVVFKGRPATDPSERSIGRKIMLVMFLSLAVSYFVGFGANLWTEYHFAATKDRLQVTPINDYGAQNGIGWNFRDKALPYTRPPVAVSYSRWGYWLTGFGGATVLSVLRLRYTWWPLHPVGLVLMTTWPISQMWFSIMVGWIAKTLVVRFGGSKLYTDVKPFMLGLLVGESVAAGFWLLMGITLSSMNATYEAVRILPQ